MQSTAFQHLIPELLGQIFEECFPDFDKSSSYADQVPLKLVCVCSHWRQVALSTPALWDRIDLKMPYDTCEGQQAVDVDTKLARKAQVFMKRSGCRPVSIWLWKWRRGGILVMKELLLHKSRWKSLNLEAIREMDAEPFAAAVASGMSSLQSLNVVTTRDFISSLPLSLETAPHLSSIVFRCCTLVSPSHPLAQVRFLQVAGDSKALANWLEHCPALEELNYDFHDDLPEDDISLFRKETQLPSLNKLKLIDASEEQSQILLNYLRAPALQSFFFKPGFDRIYGDIFLSHLRIFLQRSAPPLESLLIIANEQLLPDGFIDILSAVPTLQELRLLGPFF